MIPQLVNSILSRLRQAGYQAYAVGGCVRDLLRGETPHDWDVCTSALPEQITACFDGYEISTVGIKHGTVLIIADGKYRYIS